MSRPANQVFSFPDYTSQFQINQPQQYPGGASFPSRPGTTSTDLVSDTNQFKDGGYSFGDWAKLGTGALQAYTGYKGLGLAKDQLDFSKASFNTNLANQAQLINNEMESRQRARLETSGAYGRDTAGQASLQSDLQSYLQPRQVSGKAI